MAVCDFMFAREVETFIHVLVAGAAKGLTTLGLVPAERRHLVGNNIPYLHLIEHFSDRVIRIIMTFK